jgi:hypothetical protein
MKPTTLGNYFKGVAAKRLSAVESNRQTSNQHEFNGTAALRGIFGDDRQVRDAVFLYITDDGDLLHTRCNLTWYDARKDHPTRSEHRLYFPQNEVMDMALAGDLFILAVRPDDSLLAIVAPSGSTQANQLAWLFSLDLPEECAFASSALQDHHTSGSQFLRTQILKAIGIDDTAEWVQEQYLDLLLSRFPHGLPPTSEFSAFARETAGEPASPGVDARLLFWMEHEESLFRTYEKHQLQEALVQGFSDVDSFISFALSTLNRRKSRAGHAFENHLQEIFIHEGIRFHRGGHTENRSKPDFLFPGEAEYHQVDYPAALLTMLGAKTTCKDRWRQVLAEADRIPKKHLATLEAGISESQTEEMTSNGLTLVVPQAIQETYTAAQCTNLLSLASFVEFVRDRQGQLP